MLEIKLTLHRMNHRILRDYFLSSSEIEPRYQSAAAVVYAQEYITAAETRKVPQNAVQCKVGFISNIMSRKYYPQICL